jgi:uncharacterized protein (DUF4415 family)
MRVTYDPEKREQTLRERGSDSGRADELFAGPTVSFDDVRRDYGEARTVTIGLLDDRLTIVVWTEHANERRVISMRHCNAREKKRFELLLARPRRRPRIDDQALANARWAIGDRQVTAEEGAAAFRKALKRGRPPVAARRTMVSLRLEADVLAALRATGRGWQTRVNDLLRAAVLKKR